MFLLKDQVTPFAPELLAELGGCLSVFTYDDQMIEFLGLFTSQHYGLIYLEM